MGYCITGSVRYAQMYQISCKISELGSDHAGVWSRRVLPPQLGLLTPLSYGSSALPLTIDSNVRDYPARL